MPKVSQRGFAHIVLVVILVLGLIAGTYLVQQRTNFLPQAAKNKELSKNQLKKKIKKETLVKYIEAKSKVVKAKKEADEFTLIEGASEMTSSMAEFEDDVNKLVKKHKGKSKNKNLKKLEDFSKKANKEAKVALLLTKKVKNKNKFDEVIRKVKDKRNKLTEEIEYQINQKDLKDIEISLEEAEEYSIQEGIITAQKELSFENSFTFNTLINKFLPRALAAESKGKDAKVNEAKEDLDKAKADREKTKENLSRAQNTGIDISRTLADRLSDANSEVNQAAYDYGYELGISLGSTEAIDEQLSGYELEGATEVQNQEIEGLKAARKEVAAQEEKDAAAAAGAPPADGPPAAPGVEAPAEEAVDGTDNQGQSTGTEGQDQGPGGGGD